MTDAAIIDRPVIAITGSSGKTSTKEMVAAILQNRRSMAKPTPNETGVYFMPNRWRIFKSIQNGNDVWFTSQYAKMIDSSYHALVLEYGLRYAGDIAKHCDLIKPTIGIITNVGSAHIGNFKDEGQAGIISAKGELIAGMRQDGLLLLNADDPNSKLLNTAQFAGEILFIGLNKDADYYAEQVAYTDTGMKFQVILDGVAHPFTIPVFGKHQVYNALFAIAVTHRLGCTFNEIKHGLETFCENYSDYYQLNVQRFNQELILLSYTYCSKPCAMKAAIDVLGNISGGENVVFFGDLLAVGDYSVPEHKEVGNYLAASDVHRLYTFGIDGKYIGTGAIESGFPADRVTHLDSADLLIDSLKSSLKPQTTVLIMGFMRDENANFVEVKEIVRQLKQHCQSI